jgi:hypothetical protein
MLSAREYGICLFYLTFGVGQSLTSWAGQGGLGAPGLLGRAVELVNSLGFKLFVVQNAVFACAFVPCVTLPSQGCARATFVITLFTAPDPADEALSDE